MSQTFVMIKTDARERGLVGEVISRFENRCFQIVNMRLHCMTIPDAKELYIDHKGKHFYDRLIEFTVAPVILMILSRDDAIVAGRQVVAHIRDHFAEAGHRNLVHASDSEEAFLRESAIFFPQAEKR